MPAKRQRVESWGARSPEATSKRPRQVHVANIDPYDLPLQRTPLAVRTYVKPTPQKNGQILGLFDSFSPDKVLLATPSRRLSKSAIHVASPLRATDTKFPPLLTATPSKVAGSPIRPLTREIVTPSAQRFRSGPNSGSAKRQLDETPAFLRRHSSRIEMDAHSDDEVDSQLTFSPIAIRLPPRPAGRGLSALVQGLRNMEEERLDDDLDLLRELEAEESGLMLPKGPTTLVKASQKQDEAELPLGADGDNVDDEEDVLATETVPTTGRPWKKRGQKRTTRKSNIVPSTVKWKPEPEWTVGKDVSGDNGNAEGTEAGESKAENASATTVPAKKGRTTKVSATAHANFRALKLRSKNSKGIGTFRRGRR